MEINREGALEAFRRYVENYDIEEEKIRLKVEHTYRVSGLCQKIAESINLSKEDVDLAWLIGLLHDIGRFEQLRRYGTFIDEVSMNHGAYGAKLLFDEGRIREYVKDSKEDKLIWEAVNSHNAYRIPEDLDRRTGMFCHIIRDADKIDILKVNVDFPLEEIYNVTSGELKNAQITEAVMQCLREEKAVLKALKKTVADNLAGHISLVFELVYPVSLNLVKKQGYLERMMHFESENPMTKKQFAEIREIMGKYLERGKEENGDGC